MSDATAPEATRRAGTGGGVSNRLTVLAADIRAAHDDVGRASRQSAERAVDAGRWLAEAKADEKIPRGGWARWAEEVAGVPARTARHYVQLFNAVSKGSATLPDIAEAGQIGALKAVAEKAKQAEKAEQAARIGEAWQDMPDVAARYTLVHGPLTELLTWPAESVDAGKTAPRFRAGAGQRGKGRRGGGVINQGKRHELD
jgi:hypothetical protein